MKARFPSDLPVEICGHLFDNYHNRGVVLVFQYSDGVEVTGLLRSLRDEDGNYLAAVLSDRGTECLRPGIASITRRSSGQQIYCSRAGKVGRKS
ncbi:MAG: hypothetical protein ACM31L_11810 [Actinomycetota bacterium]